MSDPHVSPLIHNSKRMSIRVRGVVQGVGFRPFVYSLAKELLLTGWVLNDSEGVLLEVEGHSTSEFQRRLRDEAPPLARIDAVEVSDKPLTGDTGFEIRESSGGEVRTMIGADSCVCEACLSEMFDPADRRYLYPFLNCTHCGPRLTITSSLPYDRPKTSMAEFPMCQACAAEYADPLDRRFHAQPTACPECGPKLSCDIREVTAVIQGGGIVALKGIGGFHLVCDAYNDEAVQKLRARKNREAKPFAVMVLNPVSGKQHALIHDIEERLLGSRERPIVLARTRDDSRLSPSIAHELAETGLILPYAPLHFLLFHEALGRPDGRGWLSDANDVAFVLTSANPGGEPLVISNDEAVRRLSGIADLIVDHDRDILTRADDSVVRAIRGAPAIVRRARGYVPDPVPLLSDQPVTLALGAHLKSTVCVTRGNEAFVSQHIGDLDNAATYSFFRETIEHLCGLLDVTPERVACDLHPDFLSTRYAEETGLPLLRVQHHHAHTAAVAAEHCFEGAVLGLSLDGYGMGTDGGAWGGELLVCQSGDMRRIGHLQNIALPGGDAASREPWRLASAVLTALGREEDARARYSGEKLSSAIPMMVQKGLAPMTSSAGRIFDAAAGLLGVVSHQRYEAEAAIRLEALVRKRPEPEALCLVEAGLLTLDSLFSVLADETDPQNGAERFHAELADGLTRLVRYGAEETGIQTIALSGGCFLNRVLSETLSHSLETAGFKVLFPRILPPGDGAISLGQAVIAGQVDRSLFS